MRHWTKEEMEVFNLIQKAQQACAFQTEKFRDFERLIPEALGKLKDDTTKHHLQDIYHGLYNLTRIARQEQPLIYPNTPVYALFSIERDECSSTICFDEASANLHYTYMHNDYGRVFVATMPLSARDGVEEKPNRPFTTLYGDPSLVPFVLTFWDLLVQKWPDLRMPDRVGFGQPYAFSAAWEETKSGYYVVLDIYEDGGNIQFESYVSINGTAYDHTHKDFDSFFDSEAFKILTSM